MEQYLAGEIITINPGLGCKMCWGELIGAHLIWKNRAVCPIRLLPVSISNSESGISLNQHIRNSSGHYFNTFFISYLALLHLKCQIRCLISEEYCRYQESCIDQWSNYFLSSYWQKRLCSWKFSTTWNSCVLMGHYYINILTYIYIYFYFLYKTDLYMTLE